MHLPTIAAIAAYMSIGSFLVFAVVLAKAVFNPPKEASMPAAGAVGLVPDPTQAANVINAVTGLVNALSQATPAITSLAASLLFLLIAALCGGAFRPDAPQTTSCTAASTENPTMPNSRVAKPCTPNANDTKPRAAGQSKPQEKSH